MEIFIFHGGKRQLAAAHYKLQFVRNGRSRPRWLRNRMDSWNQMFYLSQSEISFHIITTESNFGVWTGDTIHFGDNIAFLPTLTWFSTSKVFSNLWHRWLTYHILDCFQLTIWSSCVVCKYSSPPLIMPLSSMATPLIRTPMGGPSQRMCQG